MSGLNRHMELNGGAPKGWSATTPLVRTVMQDPSAKPPEMYAIISTWQDGDIIGANVRNCFEQGASKVFILDNASDDDTVVAAKEAGAIIAHVYQTEFYDDDLRILHQNAIIRQQTESSGLDELWWMVLDADEMPIGTHGRTILEMVTGLPPEIRVVGSDCVDLYPSLEHEYVVGEHPAKYFTHGHWRRGNVRHGHACHHWKHALVRFFGGNYDMAHTRGNHTVAVDAGGKGLGAVIGDSRIADQRVIEPSFDIPMFHVPLRRKEHAMARLSKLCNGRNKWDDEVTRSQGAIKRWRTLEQVYDGKWSKVVIPHTQVFGREIVGLALYPWRRLMPDVRLVGDSVPAPPDQAPLVVLP